MLRKVIGCMALAAGVLLASSGSEAAKRPRKRPFALRAHAVNFDATEHRRTRSRRRRFRAYKTHSIEFDVFQKGRTGVERPTQVKLYLPNGDLYGAFDVEMFEDQTIRRKARPAATVRVPVSGTMITRYGLYGRWRAEVCWDVGSATSCHRELTFAIR